ncbi:hypothetical protein [Streptomyces reniochalinae]|uniref:Uncharacterized protein n=1 Tax=Streptomyces reniochalinae TaxID=2250578 RepID=A0A367F348_9ACTN|nr:hypothetical protein [Streptomyces reniochalinae]RCG24215.1 hypothetical protein DQ392_03585 [Streptomyces reniochalinae]
MTRNSDITQLARRIQRDSGGIIPLQQARLSAAWELGALPVHTMPPADRIPLRVAYTGESEAAARYAIGGDIHGLGLDDCSDDQRDFRALLALALFNGNVYTGPTARWNYSVVAAYDPVMSPRRDHLVMVAERAPENVATRLLSTEGEYSGSFGVPGLRHEASYTCHGQSSLRLRHLPTNALLTITGDPAGCPLGRKRRHASFETSLTVDHGLTEPERRALAEIPPISADASTLLAGLVSRYNLVDRRGHWATSLSWDPLERPESKDRTKPEVMGRGPVRQLWGAGDSWTLRWTGFPEPRDLALALTRWEAGIKGAGFTRHGDTYTVSLGTASLALCEGRD